MLSKLVKYDIKSLIRVFIPVWIVAPVIAVMLSATIHLLSVADGPLMNVFSEYIGPILLGIHCSPFCGSDRRHDDHDTDPGDPQILERVF